MVNCCTRIRTWVGILMFFGCFTSYLLRINLSVIVLQVTALGHNYTMRHWDCLTPQTYSSAKLETEPILVASLLSVYDLGYAISLLVYRSLERPLGASALIGWCTLLAAVLTLLHPYAYEYNPMTLIGLRFAIGFLGGFVLPLMNYLVIDWSPLNERYWFGMIISGGITVGVILGYPLFGYLTNGASWTWITLTTGSIAIVWSVMWLLFMRDLPIHHKCVSVAEIQEIARNRISFDHRHRKKQVPWKNVFRSIPFRALVLLMWTNTWNQTYYLNYMPLYFYQLLGYDVIWATFLASVPFIAKLLFSSICMSISRCCLLRINLSVSTVRKCFTFISHVLPGILELASLYFICRPDIDLLKTIAVLGLNGAVISGGTVNIADLAPHYAASISAKMQSLLCLAGVFMSFFVGLVIMELGNRPLSWMLVQAMNASMYLVGGVTFLKYGSGEVEQWDVSSIRSHIFHGLVDEDESEESHNSQ